MKNKPLPCGCILGEHACPEAEKLWQEVARYRLYHGPEMDEAFDTALAAYHKHFPASE
jgi:hypothetical protein